VASRPPPNFKTLLQTHASGNKPVAVVLAGHNGSGKTTLWYDRLADDLQFPLVNADRLTLSLLPPAGADNKLKTWAGRLRDEDERWQRLSQDGVQLFMGLAMDHRMSFAFETVFSYLETLPDGTVKSKIDVIHALHKSGYYVILLFVGLVSEEVSILRVSTRKNQGGHDVREAKLRSRFPRTQNAIRMASGVVDLTLMFDNSRSVENAFTLVRAQRGSEILYDGRDVSFRQDSGLVEIAGLWLARVAPQASGLGNSRP
jgi:predicted ABC-type ATPase